MAVDTRNKRASAIRAGRPWIPCSPEPDGSLAIAADRRQIGYCYSDYGLEVPPDAEGLEYAAEDERLHYAAVGDMLHYASKDERLHYRAIAEE